MDSRAKIYFMTFFVFLFLMMSRVCLSNELSLEQLIQGTNLARNNIKSGELRILVTEDSAAWMSPEEARTRVQKRREKILSSNLPPEIRQQDLERLPFLERRLSERRLTIEESNVAFQIFDSDPDWAPEAYQYKSTEIDRINIDWYGQRRSDGYFHLITYDGQTQVYEALDEFPAHSVSFFKSEKFGGYDGVSLYGRSLDRIPLTAKLVGREIIDGANCYVLEFKAVKGKSPGDLARVWIDTEKHFSVRKREIRGMQDPPIVVEVLFKDFQTYGAIWFPKVCKATITQGKQVLDVEMIYIKEVQFNIDFPDGFFEVDSHLYLKEGLRSRPDSQLSIGNIKKNHKITHLV